MSPETTKAAPGSAASRPVEPGTHSVRGMSVRVRRSAAQRLPELQDGRRDPDLELPRGALVLEIGSARFSAWLRGDGRRVIPLLERAALGRRQWDAGAAAWSFPRTLVDEVLAVADLDRIPIRLRQVDR